MLIRFSVEGYRSFAERLTLDLTRTRDYDFNTEAVLAGTVKDALVFGRNGVGKSNLLTALIDARSNVAFDKAVHHTDPTFINADADREYALFSYLLALDGHRVLYEYGRDARGTLRSERLKVDDTCVFEVDGQGVWVVNNLSHFSAGSFVVEGVEQHLGRSALSYVCANTPQNLLGPIFSLHRFLLGMRASDPSSLEEDVREVLDQGRVADLQAFLDSLGIDETLELLPVATGAPGLYLRRDRRALAFCEACSSGARALVSLFRLLELGPSRPTLLLLDDLSASFHHTVANQLLQTLIVDQEVQVIATTHDTDLFSNRRLRPDCLFVLSEHGVVAPDATMRELHEGHNLRRLYQAGAFDM